VCSYIVITHLPTLQLQHLGKTSVVDLILIENLMKAYEFGIKEILRVFSPE